MLARRYGAGLNKVFHHVHLYDEAQWSQILRRAGFEVIQCRRFALAESSVAYDLMLYPSLVGFLTKKLTGRWVLVPHLRGLSAGFVRQLVDAIGRRSGADDQKAAEYLFVCKASEPARSEDAREPGNGHY